MDEEISISFYKNGAEANKLNKASSLVLVKTLHGTMRQQCDVVNPVFIVCDDDVSTANYAYIDAFSRYYFIDRIVAVRKGVWELALRCDVLMSYRTKIENQTALIARNENEYNDRIADASRPSEAGFDFNVVNATGATDAFDMEYVQGSGYRGTRFVLIHNEINYGS